MKVSLYPESGTRNFEVICMGSGSSTSILVGTMVSTNGGEFTYTLSDDTCAGPQIKVQWTQQGQSGSVAYGLVVYFIEFHQSCA